MPRCERLPCRRCPRNVNNRTVKSTQGDLCLFNFYLFIQRQIQIVTTIPRLQNSSYRHRQKQLNLVINSKQHKPYCCTNFDKSTLFKKFLKADNVEKWCGSVGKLFHGSTTLLLKKCLYTSTRVYICPSCTAVRFPDTKASVTPQSPNHKKSIAASNKVN